jgi:hypothetical protein
MASSSGEDKDFKTFQGAAYRLYGQGKVEPPPSLKRPRDDTAAKAPPTIGGIVDMDTDEDEETRGWTTDLNNMLVVMAAWQIPAHRHYLKLMNDAEGLQLTINMLVSDPKSISAAKVEEIRLEFQELGDYVSRIGAARTLKREASGAGDTELAGDSQTQLDGNSQEGDWTGEGESQALW